jgi:murein DD-endopeptidase MepM/ murein hydrolase activator NlpD
MDKGYSIVIFPWHGMRVHRIALSPFVLRFLAVAGVTLFCVNAYFFGAYLWLRLERHMIERMKAEAERQKQGLARLYQQTEEMQRLLAVWKTLRMNVRSSVPGRRAEVAEGEPSVDALEDRLKSVHRQLAKLVSSVPSDWPVDGRVSSGVGLRASPLTGEKEFHSGLDIPGPVGAPVRAPADGVVKLVDKNRASGRVLYLDHGDGIVTGYAHLSKVHVESGMAVRKGQRIADIGNSGRSTGPHLHYEVKVNGIPIDPRRRLLKDP